ncbi:MAG: CDGSH iron-sulfur domain-containing protein [Casimicrobiaceae bacterium]
MTETVLRVRPNGPNIVTGDFMVVGARTAAGAKASASLCRCGKSGDKPFCDGTHTKIGFQDPGLLPDDAPPGTPSRGRVTITPTPNGPLECAGPLTVQGADGRTSTSEETWLCRCGQSRTKPFCDGSHEKAGFEG